MQNYKLLEKHKNKLSIYFALFILFSLWLIQGIFLGFIYHNENKILEMKLITKYNGVENILKNKDAYFKNIEENNFATRILVEKTLEGVTIIENGNKILGDINHNLIGDSRIFNSKSYKFYQNNTVINGNDYKIITKLENNSSYYKFTLNYIYFLIFSTPFILLFFNIGYIFVGKNFKPIKETINSLEDFSANINHEMKTPLAEMISTLSLAKKVKGNYEEAINQSLDSSKKLNKILDSMLGIINLVGSSYSKENTNIINEINNIINENLSKIKEKNIRIKTYFSHKKFNLNINKEHFDICVSNILSNAIKYSNKDGLIEVKFDNGVLEIKDYGIGIEETNIKNVFDRYFRENYTNEEGYGLGLALIKKITDINEWEIGIESKKNKGTTAKINFTKKSLF